MKHPHQVALRESEERSSMKLQAEPMVRQRAALQKASARWHQKSLSR